MGYYIYIHLQSHSVWGAWIEIYVAVSQFNSIGSHSVWGAWIEIKYIANVSNSRKSILAIVRIDTK